MPAYGDTRVAPCTWCHAPDILQTFRSYEDGMAGGYWDTGNCPCGKVAGLINFGATIARNEAKRTDKRPRFRNGVVRGG